jgi:hypothetical protein
MQESAEDEYGMRFSLCVLATRARNLLEVTIFGIIQKSKIKQAYPYFTSFQLPASSIFRHRHSPLTVDAQPHNAQAPASLQVLYHCYVYLIWQIADTSSTWRLVNK